MVVGFEWNCKDVSCKCVKNVAFNLKSDMKSKNGRRNACISVFLYFFNNIPKSISSSLTKSRSIHIQQGNINFASDYDLRC